MTIDPNENASPLFRMEPDTGILHMFTSSGEVRAYDINGQMWLLANDLAIKFGVRSGADLVQSLPNDPNMVQTYKVRLNLVDGRAQLRDMLVISEAGLDMLCMRSNNPALRQFQYEVLKIIQHVRHTGMFIQPQLAEPMAFNPNIAQEQARRYVEFCKAFYNTAFTNPIHGHMFREIFWANARNLAHQREVEALQGQINQMQEQVNIANTITNAANTISLDELAKLIWNFDVDIGRNRLMEKLRNDDFLMKKGEVNVPTQLSVNAGLMVMVLSDTGFPTARVTPYGIDYFIKKYKDTEVPVVIE